MVDGIGNRVRENSLSNTQRYITQGNGMGMGDVYDDLVDQKMRRSLMQQVGQNLDPYSKQTNKGKLDAFDDIQFPANFAEKQIQRQKIKEKESFAMM